jgi:hypothetical protein
VWQVVEEAVQAERSAMAVRLLTTFESLKALAQSAPGQLSSHGGRDAAPLPAAAASDAHMRGAMASLLGVRPGEEPARRLGGHSPVYNSSSAAPFTAIAGGVCDAGGEGLLGRSLASIFSSYAPASAAEDAPAQQPAYDSGLFGKPKLGPLKSAVAKPFSLFNSLEGASIWS